MSNEYRCFVPQHNNPGGYSEKKNQLMRKRRKASSYKTCKILQGITVAFLINVIPKAG